MRASDPSQPWWSAPARNVTRSPAPSNRSGGNQVDVPPSIGAATASNAGVVTPDAAKLSAQMPRSTRARVPSRSAAAIASSPARATPAASVTPASFSGEGNGHSRAKIRPASTSSASGISAANSARMPGDMPSTPTRRAEVKPGIALSAPKRRSGFHVIG